MSINSGIEQIVPYYDSFKNVKVLTLRGANALINTSSEDTRELIREMLYILNGTAVNYTYIDKDNGEPLLKQYGIPVFLINASYAIKMGHVRYDGMSNLAIEYDTVLTKAGLEHLIKKIAQTLTGYTTIFDEKSIREIEMLLETAQNPDIKYVIEKIDSLTDLVGRKTYITTETQKKDEEGNPVFDEEGNPVYEVEEIKGAEYFNEYSGLNKALGEYSHSEGRNTIASGYASHTEGGETSAESDYTHAEGWGTQAIGAKTHAEGRLTHAIGQNSHSEGSETIAEGEGSHAEGQSSQAIGIYSHAEGWSSQSDGIASHAEGYSDAKANYSHSEGYGTNAEGQRSHAEGYQTTASGHDSHAEGYHTTSYGRYSHAEGYNNTTISNNQSQLFSIMTLYSKALGKKISLGLAVKGFVPVATFWKNSGTTAYILLDTPITNILCNKQLYWHMVNNTYHYDTYDTLPIEIDDNTDAGEILNSKTPTASAYISSFTDLPDTISDEIKSRLIRVNTVDTNLLLDPSVDGMLKKFIIDKISFSGLEIYRDGTYAQNRSIEKYINSDITDLINWSDMFVCYDNQSDLYDHPEYKGNDNMFQKIFVYDTNGTLYGNHEFYNTVSGLPETHAQHVSGEGNTNVSRGGSLVGGRYADIKDNTLFAIGNGTTSNDKHNAIEILGNGDTKIDGNLTINGDIPLARTDKLYANDAKLSSLKVLYNNDYVDIVTLIQTLAGSPAGGINQFNDGTYAGISSIHGGGTNIYAGPIRATSPGQLTQYIIIQDASIGHLSSHDAGYSDSITAYIDQLDSSAEYQVAVRIRDASTINERFTMTSNLSGISEGSDVNTSLKIAALDSNGNNVNLSFGPKDGNYQYSTSNIKPDQYGKITLTITPGDSVFGSLNPEDDPYINYTPNGVAIEIFVEKQTS